MNTIISSTKKAFRFIVLFAALTGSITVFAANGPNEEHPGSASTAEVKYVGVQEGEPLFNVLYNNIPGGRFSVRVQDSDGRLLYQGFYQDKKFDKKFKITNADGAKLVFVVRNFTDNSVQRFEVNTDNRMVEDIEVKEVK